MLFLDLFSLRRVVKGVVAFHDATESGEDGQKAFARSVGFWMDDETVTVLVEYPDLAKHLLVVVDLDYDALNSIGDYGLPKDNNWSEAAYIEEREQAVSRYETYRVLVAYEHTELIAPRPVKS